MKAASTVATLALGLLALVETAFLFGVGKVSTGQPLVIRRLDAFLRPCVTLVLPPPPSGTSNQTNVYFAREYGCRLRS